MVRYVITAAPPNPNGDLHLGHLAGPFLGADVQARYLRLQGHDVTHVMYIDEHSCYVPRRARELGSDPYEAAHLLGDRIEETLALAHMSPDFCGRPHRDTWHDQLVQSQFGRLREKGAFFTAPGDVFFCDTCQAWLYEAEVRGACHHCGAPSDGFYCEECGRPQQSGRLREPLCTTCWQPPRVASHERVFFRLEDYRQQLAAYYAGRPMRPHLREYLDLMLRAPLPATPVSRIGDYGVPVPGWTGHYLDTWFSGIFGYAAAVHGARRVSGRPDVDDAWRDGSTVLREFIGFDCSFSHAILWPAMALALGDNPLPDEVVTNEFYKLEGAKFSTSRSHAIWGGQFLREVPADALRFFLCLTGPEQAQTNFSMREFRDVTQQVLVEHLGGILQAFDDAAGGEEREEGGAGLDRWTADLAGAVGEHLEPQCFSPSSAAAEVARFLEQSEEVAALAAVSSADARRRGLCRLAQVLEPFMPGWATDVRRALDPDHPLIRGLLDPPSGVQSTIAVDGQPVAVRGVGLALAEALPA